MYVEEAVSALALGAVTAIVVRTIKDITIAARRSLLGPKRIRIPADSPTYQQ
jgi:hypothetical protein